MVWRRIKDPPKRPFLSAKLHRVTSQKAEVYTSTTVGTQNLGNMSKNRKQIDLNK
jgi:hypothetical protein